MYHYSTFTSIITQPLLVSLLNLYSYHYSNLTCIITQPLLISLLKPYLYHYSTFTHIITQTLLVSLLNLYSYHYSNLTCIITQSLYICINNQALLVHCINHKTSHIKPMRTISQRWWCCIGNTLGSTTDNKPRLWCSYKPWGSCVYRTSIAKCPSLRARCFSVCRLRARVVHRHIHYRRRFSVRASIVIRHLLTLDDHCVKIWLKDVVLIFCVICANTRTYSHTRKISWQIRNFMFWLL